MAGNLTQTESLAAESRVLQVSLGGLMVLVLAAGVAAGVARSAREVWGLRVMPAPSSASGSPVWGTSAVPTERTAGAALEIVAVFMLVLLARTLIGIFRGNHPTDPLERRTRSWAIAWRTVAACFLLWFVSAESQVLRISFVKEIEISTLVPGWGSAYRVRQQLLPACGLFAMLGLLLGSGASFLLPRTPRRTRRPYWLFVILAGVAAVLIVSTDYIGSLIVHLILVALEAVTYAMHHGPNLGRGLWTRLLHAGSVAAGAATLCLALALAVARDFEMLRRGNSLTPSRAGKMVRLLLLAGTAGAGLYVATVAIPAIHFWFAAGFRQVVGRTEGAMILSGFGFFGAGMAARALAGAPEQQSRWISLLRVLYRLSILSVILFATLNVLPDSSQLGPLTHPFVGSIVDQTKEAIARFWNQFPDPFTTSALKMLAFDNLLWTALVLATACFVIELLIRDNVKLNSPFDQLAASPERARQFLWLVAGFVVICVSAIPILIVASQAVMLLRLVGGDMRSGWGN